MKKIIILVIMTSTISTLQLSASATTNQTTPSISEHTLPALAVKIGTKRAFNVRGDVKTPLFLADTNGNKITDSSGFHLKYKVRSHKTKGTAWIRAIITK